MMARATIHLYATLRAFAGGAAEVEVEFEPGQTIEQVLTRIGVPPEQTRILFVNNRAAVLEQPLQGGERVGVFPAIGGG
jgi:molybdopterin converting factor small subunit